MNDATRKIHSSVVYIVTILASAHACCCGQHKLRGFIEHVFFFPFNFVHLLVRTKFLKLYNLFWNTLFVEVDKTAFTKLAVTRALFHLRHSDNARLTHLELPTRSCTRTCQQLALRACINIWQTLSGQPLYNITRECNYPFPFSI